MGYSSDELDDGQSLQSVPSTVKSVLGSVFGSYVGELARAPLVQAHRPPVTHEATILLTRSCFIIKV